jgi:hypothetical protein
VLRRDRASGALQVVPGQEEDDPLPLTQWIPVRVRVTPRTPLRRGNDLEVGVTQVIPFRTGSPSVLTEYTLPSPQASGHLFSFPRPQTDYRAVDSGWEKSRMVRWNARRTRSDPIECDVFTRLHALLHEGCCISIESAQAERNLRIRHGGIGQSTYGVSIG